MLSAQSSGAKIVGLANGGTDTMNAIKTARDFGLVDRGQQLAVDQRGARGGAVAPHAPYFASSHDCAACGISPLPGRMRW